MKKVVCIVQARTGSTRLPNKIFLKLGTKTVLDMVLERLGQSKRINRIVVASPASAENDVIEKYVTENYPAVNVSRGSEQDVLDRYYQAATTNRADYVVRITSDCPFIDPDVVDTVIGALVNSDADYAANVLGKRTYPRGLDVEAFTYEALKRMWTETQDPEDREHVTQYLLKNPQVFKAINVENSVDYSEYRLTLDEDADYVLLTEICNRLSDIENFRLSDIVVILEEDPELTKHNSHVQQKYAQY